MATINRKLQTALRRIRDAHKTGARTLDLSGLGLRELPQELGELRLLHNLNVSRNQLFDLPEWLGRLPVLQGLIATASGISSLHFAQSGYGSLKTLDLSSNCLESLSGDVGNAVCLQSLNLENNQLGTLPSNIGSVLHLKELCISGNNLSDLPGSLFSLRSLSKLSASRNNIITVPAALGQARLLRHIDLAHNQILLIPNSVEDLIHLRFLDLSHNRLVALPESLRHLLSLDTLRLIGNESLGLPHEILAAALAPRTILTYYLRARKTRRPLNEAKLILVGRGGVGKTCVANRLLHGTFDAQQAETPGIEIQPWEFAVPGSEQPAQKIRVNVWDFGGQEILHATHQFFLTERTLYLLVLSGREGKPTEDAEYWLQLIRSFGGDSRVIVVLNKSEQHQFDVNRGLLLEKYGSTIVDFLRTECSAQSDGGFDELKQMVQREVYSLQDVRTGFPAEWFAIKERLATTDENYVTWDRYQKICHELGEPDIDAQRQLADFLHVLGIALNYRDDARLRDTHVLNPRWVTEGIYPILRAGQMLQSRGVLEKHLLAAILDGQRYPATTHDFLLRLMEKFQLCFPLSLHHESPRWLIPQLLGESQPAEIAEHLRAPGLGFRYQYKILAESLMPRFIVQTHTHSESVALLRWRSGVVLKRDGVTAVVRADAQERRVDIHVTGTETRRRELLAVVRAAFDQQHAELRGLQMDERILVPGTDSVTVSYKKLLSLEERGIDEYEAEGVDETLSVRSLLSGIESPRQRERRGRGQRTTPPEMVCGAMRGKIDVAIITIRHDEYDAMESRLTDSVPLVGGNNSYEYASVEDVNGREVRVALTRCVSQGNTSAQAVANNIIADLDPAWLFLVGIAGGVPDFEFSLGDVIIASALHDFSFGASKDGGQLSYQSGGGSMHPDVVRFLQTKIGGRNRQRLAELAGFATDDRFEKHPPVPSEAEKSLYGSDEFRADVARKLAHRYPGGQRKGALSIHSGPCANGNLVVKDTVLLEQWQQSARQIAEVETEMVGVYEAARSAGRQNYPLLAIRGISDIVGAKRAPEWTAYACETAAAVAHAILRSGFIDFSSKTPDVGRVIPD